MEISELYTVLLMLKPYSITAIIIYEYFFEIEKLCNLSEGPKEILDVFVEHYELWMWDILPNILL